MAVPAMITAQTRKGSSRGHIPKAAAWGAMRQMLRHAVFTLALGAGLLQGCATGYVPPGQPMTTPTLATDALMTADGTQLPLRVWSADQTRAVVVALHGFNDYSTAFQGPASWWAQHGITTYAYDQRGFGAAPNRGRWPGPGVHAGDATEAVAQIRGRHPGVPVYLLGESMGGAVALTAMTGANPPKVDGVILIAPAVRGRAALGLVPRATLAVVSTALPWLTLSGRGLGIRASDNDDMLRAFSRDPMVIKETRADTVKGLVDLMDAALESAERFDGRALILYGEKDQLIPKAPTALMLDRFPDAARPRQRLVYYPNGWHMLLRDLQGEVVWNDIKTWLHDQEGILPSGADRQAYARMFPRG
jgi:alpha-beta hydrolase superfamily lysophospholipase